MSTCEFPNQIVNVHLGEGRILINPFENSQTRDDDWCQCSACVNWRIARQLFLPRELGDKLKEFGFTFGQFAGHISRAGKTPPGTYRASRFFVLASARVDGRQPLRQSFGRWHRMEIGRASADEAQRSEVQEPDAFVLRVSAVVPYFASALNEFEQDNSTKCPHCGSTWMSSGRIRSRERITKWFKLRVARKGQILRVCWDCLKPSLFRPGADSVPL
jgi:hypothetical protein